ncbi:serine/threonine protein kinase [Microvenator marinus]|uniref:serine/threonine protein kinase n=1 Tax=Microvenator marinus TaxID=2600177 RepID=UPI00201B7464|nr:serine/threonine-protein kinase [Microvenator marinus]
MKSTLVELPPELIELIEDSDVIEDISSVDELVEFHDINDEKVIKRLLMPGAPFGPYKILKFVAAGGMGEVYAAERQMQDGRRLGPVALKVISPEYMDDWAISERFKREAQISRAIRSPHVTRVYEFGQTQEGHAFLAMEMLKGEELFDRMYTRRMSQEESVEVVLEILAGLKAVHDAGFVHRDIKPENVYFNQRDGLEMVKLLDFGIAKVKDQRSDPFLSVVGKIYGTPEYISPEQGLNPDVDERSDLYSVGVILYELLAGRLPFDGDSAYAIILAHQSQAPPAMGSSVDAKLTKIVMKALEKRPEERYQSASDFQDDLRKWLDFRRDDFMADSAHHGRFRQDTPHHAKQTPMHGVPSPGLSEPSESSEAPPVQIFSRPRRRHQPTPHVSTISPAPERETPKESKPLALSDPSVVDPRDEKAHGSTAAKIITGVIIVLVLALVAWLSL